MDDKDASRGKHVWLGSCVLLFFSRNGFSACPTRDIGYYITKVVLLGSGLLVAGIWGRRNLPALMIVNISPEGHRVHRVSFKCYPAAGPALRWKALVLEDCTAGNFTVRSFSRRAVETIPNPIFTTDARNK